MSIDRTLSPRPSPMGEGVPHPQGRREMQMPTPANSSIRKAFAGTIRSRAARCLICCRRRRREFGARPAIEFRDRPISYAELEAMVEVAAAAFLRAGYGSDQSVALFLGNSPDHPVNFFGALKAGARIVHLSPLDGEIALSHKLSDSGARVLVTSDLATLLPMALKFLEKGLIDRLIVCEDDDWGAVGNPHTPIPDDPRDRHLQDIHRRRAPPARMAAAHGRRCRAAAIYRRHHRPAEGRDAQPRQSDRGGVDLRRLGRQGARRAQRPDRARDLRAAAVSHLRADRGAAQQPPARPSDLAAPALRRRGGDARHRGQARHRIFPACRRCGSRSPHSPISTSATCRRWSAVGSGGAPLPVEVAKDPRAQGRHEAEERLGHDRDLLARHRPSQGGTGQAGLDRADAAGHRNGRGRARRSEQGAAAGRNRRNPHPRAERHQRLLEPADRRPPRLSSATASSPATSATWTTTAISIWSTARRT